MIWPRLKIVVAAGTAVILLTVAAGTALLLDRGERAATAAAAEGLERSAQAVENALNRQLLQVHGALASLPSLFAAAKTSPQDTTLAAELLGGLNFQTLAYRDLMLVGPDGTVLATARPHGAQRELPFKAEQLQGAPLALLGPLRNKISGDWSLYLARTVPQWGGVIPVAEVPLLTLMKLLAETGVDPQVRIALQRRDGQLIAALPHDELRTGERIADEAPLPEPDGIAVLNPAQGEQERTFIVARLSLYNDVRVVLSAPRQALLATWLRDRDRVLFSVAIGMLLVGAFGALLILALGQRERMEAERVRSASVLVNAIEAMSDGFVMWDSEDRLVTCNQRFRDIYAMSAPFMVPGTHFDAIVRQAVEAGQYDVPYDEREALIAQMIAMHRDGTGSAERQLSDGRWILIRERRTADGGMVGIRADITALKSAQEELAEANARANAAAAEARRQNAALIEREGQIRFLAHHDDLTRLPNRVLFRSRIDAALQAAAERGERLALLYLDLDRFKDVNDTLGHPVGDALLRAAAARLSHSVADDERVARLGGDEFAVISLASDQPDTAQALSERIIGELSTPYSILGHTIAASASVGIAISDGTELDADALLKQADLALYHAKAEGRGTYCVFTPEMDAHLRGRIELETDLRAALEGHQFHLVYQPIFDLADNGLTGFEALLRWQHPERGLVSPATFIPLAEETRLIVDIGAWALERACADIADLPGSPRLAVNLSPVQLAVGDLTGMVSAILERTGFDASRLELEITETALFDNNARNLEALRKLKDLGVGIVLDDFGTGYSSLSHLRLFPLDKIKIDRSFVREMAVRPDSAAIVDTIADLAARLGMSTTAEGIETAEQQDVARQAGCTHAQGFFLGRPQPLEQARTLAAAQDGRPRRLGRRGTRAGHRPGDLTG